MHYYVVLSITVVVVRASKSSWWGIVHALAGSNAAGLQFNHSFSVAKAFPAIPMGSQDRQTREGFPVRIPITRWSRYSTLPFLSSLISGGHAQGVRQALPSTPFLLQVAKGPWDRNQRVDAALLCRLASLTFVNYVLCLTVSYKACRVGVCSSYNQGRLICL